jgi:hypothetical protein
MIFGRMQSESGSDIKREVTHRTAALANPVVTGDHPAVS